jgi:hypothetical protein
MARNFDGRPRRIIEMHAYSDSSELVIGNCRSPCAAEVHPGHANGVDEWGASEWSGHRAAHDVSLADARLSA